MHHLKIHSALLLGLLAFAALAGCERRHDIPIAKVNGEAINGEEFMTALSDAHGPEILNRLVTEKLIMQEAKKQNLTVSSDEVKSEAKKISDTDPVPQGLLQQVKASLLLRKITLNGITEEKKRTVFAAFHEQLATLELSQITVASEDVAKQVVVALETGSKFEELAATSSFDPQTKTRGGLVGMVSRRALILNLGPQITQQVLSLKAGQTSPAIRFRKTSWVIFRVNKILKTYEELEPTIIDILAEAALNQVLYGIRERAAIESPYLTKTRAKVPLPGQEQAPAKPEKPGLRGADVNLVPGESPAVPSAPTPDAPAISLPAPEDKPPDLAPPTGTK